MAQKARSTTIGFYRSTKWQSTDSGRIVFLPDNPVKLFYQLTKLLAATKAGHSNTYNQVNAILQRLLELKLITTDKYKKVLSKYFPTKGK